MGSVKQIGKEGGLKWGWGCLCSEDWNTVTQVCPSTQNLHEVPTSNTAKADMNVGMNETHRANI